MAILTVLCGETTCRLPFSGTPTVQSVLEAAGMGLELPCGGQGRCGKCAVRLRGAVSAPNEAERIAGVRLSCQARLLGDAEVQLPQRRAGRIEQQIGALEAACPMGHGYGAAVDIGTTTVVLKLYDLHTGALLGSCARMNPQRTTAADVMGRIGAALAGQALRLQQQIEAVLGAMLDEACAGAGISRAAVDAMVVAGNTTMLYLLTGRNPECLSHAPFEADTLFGTEAELLGIRTFYPPCMNAFVGADLTCAVLASGMMERPRTALLCDIGTNGEIALWKDGRLHVTSTAAGPAFEGAGISSGCCSVEGAIDRVWVENGQLRCRTIGGQKAVGICGSGLIDAIAALLETGQVDETGACDTDFLELRDGIGLIPRDIRAVQLAKAAIAAGIQTLLETVRVPESEIETLCIAGGFGAHLNVESAAAIGLIPPALTDRVKILGNASLAGAAALLLDRRRVEEAQRLARQSRHVSLGGNPRFNEHYMEQMLFGDDELFD